MFRNNIVRKTTWNETTYLFGPRSLDQVWIHYFRPSLLALNIRAIRKILRDDIPPFSILFDEVLQVGVFFFTPASLVNSFLRTMTVYLIV